MSTPANQIPPHPGVAAQVAAAGPAVRVAQDNQMIPPHPGVTAAMATARSQITPPAAPQNLGEDFSGDGEESHPQSDWFGAAATGAPTPERHLAPPTLPPGAPASPGSQQPGDPSYSDIDQLLDGIPIPGEVPAQPGQQGTQQAQQPGPGVVVPTAPQFQPQQPQTAPQAPAGPPPLDAEAAQKAAIDLLMGREYALSEVDQRRLIAEPETVIPRLAAQVHVNVTRDIGSRIGQVIPQLVNRLVEQQLVGMRRETEFFSRYPKLANPAFRETVESSLSMVKAANPNITQEQLFQEGASYAAFRIRQQYQGQQRAAGGQPPVRSAVQPFVPMSPGAPSVPTAPQNSNPFAELANATDLFDW